MSGLAGYARGGQGGNVSKSKKARGMVEKAGAPFTGAATPLGDDNGNGDDGTPETPETPAMSGDESNKEHSVGPGAPEGAPGGAPEGAPEGAPMTPSTPTSSSASPSGEVGDAPPLTAQKSMADYARSGQVSKQAEGALFEPSPQPRVASDIPGAGPQGVPPAERDELGAFARRGNADMIPQAVAMQTGLASHGPAVAASVARMGGQVRLAPGQFGAWAHPLDPAPKATSDQAPFNPPPAKPVY